MLAHQRLDFPEIDRGGNSQSPANRDSRHHLQETLRHPHDGLPHPEDEDPLHSAQVDLAPGQHQGVAFAAQGVSNRTRGIDSIQCRPEHRDQEPATVRIVVEDRRFEPLGQRRTK